MSSPPSENPHLALPSISPPCPFINLPHDPIDHIFALLTNDVKSKMHLELVCAKFASRIKERICWKLDDTLVIGGDGESFNINGIQFNLQRALRAFEILLMRITVRHIVVNHTALNQSFIQSICAIIGRHRNSFALRSIKFEVLQEAFGGIDLNSLLAALTVCNLSEVQQIIWNSERGNFKNVWLLLENCINVRNIDFEICTPFELSRFCNSLKNCTKLQSLTVRSCDPMRIENTQISDFTALCNSMKYLKYLNILLLLPSAYHFALSLTEECRSEVVQLSVKPVIHELAINFSENVATLFVNLKELVFDGKWECETVVSTVANIITTINGEQMDNFKLIMKGRDVGQCLNSLRMDNNVIYYHSEGVVKCVRNGKPMVLLEAGCGVGNFLFPFMEEFSNWNAYACDFSPRAVKFVKEHESYNENRMTVFQCDLTLEEGDSSLSNNIPTDTVDLCTLIFVLSAIHPEKMNQVVEHIYKVLKPGASVIVRDYGLYDHAMLRFAKGNKLKENLYVRQDGTRAYYFSVETLTQLFTHCNFQTVTASYVHRETVNKKEGISVPRIFVQARFRKV